MRCASGSLGTLQTSEAGPDIDAQRVIQAAILVRDNTQEPGFTSAYRGSVPFGTLARAEDSGAGLDTTQSVLFRSKGQSQSAYGLAEALGGSRQHGTKGHSLRRLGQGDGCCGVGWRPDRSRRQCGGEANSGGRRRNRGLPVTRGFPEISARRLPGSTPQSISLSLPEPPNPQASANWCRKGFPAGNRALSLRRQYVLVLVAFSVLVTALGGTAGVPQYVQCP